MQATPIDFDAMERAQAALQRAETPVVLGELPVVGVFDRTATGSVEPDADGVHVRVDGELDDWVMLNGGLELDPDELPLDDWTVVGPRDHWLYACTGPEQHVVFWEHDVQALRVRPSEEGWLDVVASVGRGQVLAARVPAE